MGTIIAITGMEGAGKTTLLSNLAYALTANGNIVGCLSCDLRYPSLPRHFGIDIPADKSLGKLFDEENPASHFIERSEGENLFISATSHGESSVRYEPPDQEVIETFLERLSIKFDYVLIEAGMSEINAFSAYAILQANEIINVIACTVEGMEYEESCYPSLLAFNPSLEPINVLNMTDDVLRSTDYKSTDIKISVELPAHQMIRKSASEGMPIIRAKEKNRAVRAYCLGVQSIAKMLMEGGINE